MATWECREEDETRRMPTACRALIVDDDDDLAFLAAMTIEAANNGLSVAGVASSGKEAIDMLHDTPADVVVLDYRMPDANGLEVAAELLALDPKRSIILFSAFLEASTVEAADRLGVRECLSKDDIKGLPDAIRRCCRSL
jgi:DNA-binding NarL/FixJ family response regulator